MGKSYIITGAQCLCYINGKIYAQVTGIRWNNAMPKKEIRGIDVMTYIEAAPTTLKVSGTLNLLRLRYSGGLQGAGIVAPYNRLPNEKYFQLIIQDRVSRTIIFRADQCSAEGESWGVNAKGLLTGVLRFSAPWNTNEVEVA